MESLFTRVAHHRELFNTLRHIDTSVFIGFPAPVLSVHRAREIREGRILRRRCHESEALFVLGQVRAEHLIRDGVASGQYPSMSSLFCEHYEVSFNLHVCVPSIVLYYGNFLPSARDTTPNSALFYHVIYCLFYTECLR